MAPSILSTHCGPEHTGPARPRSLVFEGPTLVVDLGHSVRPFQRGAVDQRPLLQCPNVDAIIDTGAGANCVDQSLVMAMREGIQANGLVRVGGLHGIQPALFYGLQIHVPGLMWSDRDRFAALDLRACGHGHQVVLGRPFLSKFKLSYDGPNGSVILHLPDGVDFAEPDGATRVRSKIAMTTQQYAPTVASEE